MNARLKPAAIVATALALTASALAGDTDPPPGAIAPTMKPLDAIEPRTCIAELPTAPDALHVISLPGAYVLTSDLVVPAGSHGILISLAPGATSGHVTIDLNGFSIIGTPGSLDAIRVGFNPQPEPPGKADVYSTRGRARISGLGGDGIHVDNADTVSLAGIDISDCLSNGADVHASKKLFVGGLSFSNNGGAGLNATSCEAVLVDKAYVDNQTGAGISITDVRQCTIGDVRASDNGGPGISITTHFALGTYALSLRKCESVGSELQGIVVLCHAGSTSIDLDKCTASGNGGNGIDTRVDPSASCWIRVSQTQTNDNGGGPASPDPGHGIVIAETAGPTRGAGGAGAGGRITIDYDSGSSSGNTGDGLRVIQAFNQMNQAVIRNIRSATNDGDGVHLDCVAGSLTVEHSTSTANAGHGYVVQYRETDLSFACKNSSATGNGADGFHADSPVGLCGPIHATGCTASSNAGSGFNLACTAGGAITLCHARDNAGSGFVVLGAGHTIVRNTAGGNTSADYAVSLPGNALGPIVTESDISTSASPHANYQAP